MRVLAVVHGPLVGPELFAPLVSAAGHELLEWEIAAAGGAAPPPADAVLVLGGRMNVGEEVAYPWLEQEYELLRGWVAARTPLLGICLGAQTLAHAFGARVAPLPRRHAGFRTVRLTGAGRRDRLLGRLPECFEALFANGYAFELPAGAVALGETESDVPCYRLGPCAWGLQFHPEARREQVLAWWRETGDLPRPLAELEPRLSAGIERWQELGASLCRGFLAAAEAAAREPTPAARP